MNLHRKGTPWVFSDDCHKSFKYLKNSFTPAPILAHWEPNWPLVVETDTSDYTLAVIISMQNSEGELHPISFHSHTFTGAKLNYNVHDKELMVIFEAFKHWRHYLKGSTSPIDVVTNHKNLEYFCTMKLLTQRQACWSKYFSQFNLIIRFHPSKLGAKPNALTRRWDVYVLPCLHRPQALQGSQVVHQWRRKVCEAGEWWYYLDFLD